MIGGGNKVVAITATDPAALLPDTGQTLIEVFLPGASLNDNTNQLFIVNLRRHTCAKLVVANVRVDLVALFHTDLPHHTKYFSKGDAALQQGLGRQSQLLIILKSRWNQFSYDPIETAESDKVNLYVIELGDYQPLHWVKSPECDFIVAVRHEQNVVTSARCSYRMCGEQKSAASGADYLLSTARSC